VPSFVTALLMTTFFFAGMAVAIPIIDKLGSARLPRRRRPASVRDQAALLATGPAFTPLEMADSGQKWPSEVPDRRTPLVMPAWPSENWTDNPFPASAAIARQLADAPPRSQTTPMATPQRQVAVEPTQSRPQSKLRAKPKARPRPKRARPQPKRQPTPEPERPRRATPAPKAKTSAPAAQGGLPEPAILLEIANDPSRGLASAVDFVRQTTGWSFQRAAQHVASVLRSNS
jgi:hypothetical protein